MKSLFIACISGLILLTSCHGSRKLAAGEPLPKATRKKIIALAVQYMGSPYLYGGVTPKGFDCSGFVQYIFAKNGIAVPRTTRAMASWGKEIPLRKAQVADLILFTGSNASGPVGHVGIITCPDGKDTEFIHAGSAGKNGGVVMASLSTSYFSRRFVKVVSVVVP